MPSFRRTVVPALIGLLVVAEISTAVVGAGNLRADQRRAAAIAKEKRAVASYRKALQPTLLQVFDTVQPLQDAADAFADPGPGLTVARDDVILHTGAAAALHAQAAAVKGVRVPRSLTKSAKELTLSLDQLIGAADKLAAATHAHGDKTGYVAEFNGAYALLTVGEADLSDAVLGTYGDASTTPVPGADRAGAHGRKVPTRGSFVLAADRACGRASYDDDQLDDPKTPAAYVSIVSKEVAIIKRLNATLLTLKTAPADEAIAGHRIQTLLKAEAVALPRALSALVDAVKRQDPAKGKAADSAFAMSLPTMRDLSHAYHDYGASLCANFFDVTDLLAPKGGGSLST